MNRILLKKIFPLVLIFTLLVTQTVAYAIDVEIDDLTPDLEAPKLISIVASSQEMTPSSSVKISAEVTDNLSGVDRVVLYLKKSSGATKGFYLYLNSATNKYEVTVSVGKIDEPGLWEVQSVTLSDKKNNNRSIYRSDYDFSKLDLNVSGVTLPEKEPPVLHDISIKSRNVSVGQSVEVSAHVSDNESGVSSVVVYYKKPSGKIFSIPLYKNNSTGKFEGSKKIDQFEELDVWSVSYVYLQDQAQNSIRVTSYRDINNEIVNFDHCSIEVSGTTPDLEAPILDNLAIELKQISSSSASVILTAKAVDALSGINRINGYYVKPSGKTLNLNFYASGDSYIATIPIDRYDESGKWELKQISVVDQMDNSKTYNDLNEERFFNVHDINISGKGKISISPGIPFGIDLNYSKLSLKSGESLQLQAILNFTDKTKKEITNDRLTVYSSTNPSLASVNNSGMITIPAGAGFGNAVIEVSYGDITKSVVVEVNGGFGSAFLNISPLNLKLSAGQQAQIEVIEIHNGLSKDITNTISGIQYTSLNPSLAIVSQNGLIKIADGVEKGIAAIQIKYGDLLGEVTVAITKPIVTSMALSPLEENLSLTNNKLQLVVKGFMSNGTTKDITASSTGTKYVSSNILLAEVSSEGVVTVPEAAKSGVVTINATNNGLTVKSIITIAGNPELVNLELESFPSEMEIGEDKQLVIKTLWSDGSEKVLQLQDVKITNSRPDRVAITPEGVIKALSAGTTNISIFYEGKYYYSAIKVLPPPSISSFYLDTPIPSTMIIGEESTVTGLKVKMSNGEINNIDAQNVIFSSSRSDRVSITPEGRLTALSAGISNIGITYEGKVIQFSVSVKSASTLNSVYLKTPVPATMKIGDTQTIDTVYGKWSDGKETVISGADLTFSSSRPDRVSVTTDGILTAKSSGTSNINISYEGNVVSITIKVESAPIMSSIYLDSNPTLTMKISDVQTIGIVKAKWSNGDETVINPADLTFSSSRPDRISVTTDGTLTAKLSGTSSINISYEGKTVDFTIKVESPPPISSIYLEIDPTLTMKIGDVQTIGTVKAKWSNGDEAILDPTDLTFSSSRSDRVFISSDGELSALSTGTSNIKLLYLGKYISFNIKVTTN